MIEELPEFYELLEDDDEDEDEDEEETEEQNDEAVFGELHDGLWE